jgi:hypothetical protein
LNAGTDVAVKFELENADQRLEAVAVSGTIDVLEYSWTSSAPENPIIVNGGAIGGVYSLVFPDGEQLSGSFHVAIGDAIIAQ